MPRLRRKALLKSNLEYWLNDLLLKEGLYTNVASGDMNIYGETISRMIPVEDEDFIDGQVWQSAFKNWVYEPGIPSAGSGIAPPTIASGVYVNGTFYGEATASGAFAHQIDFENGRVIFDSPISTNSTVDGQFSYKEVFVAFADSINNENEPLQLETTYKDNPYQTGVITYPTKESRTLPAIWIDLTGRDNEGYELGSRSIVSDFVGVLHVWARDSYLGDLVEDILADEQRAVLIGVDFNTAQFPLLARGERNPSWPGYASQANVHSSDFWRRIYLDSVSSRQDAPLYEIERTRVRFLARIYPNF